MCFKNENVDNHQKKTFLIPGVRPGHHGNLGYGGAMPHVRWGERLPYN